MKKKIKSLKKLREEKNASGGIDKLKKRASQGKLNARERLEYFFDPGTWWWDLPGWEVNPWV